MCSLMRFGSISDPLLPQSAEFWCIGKRTDEIPISGGGDVRGPIHVLPGITTPFIPCLVSAEDIITEGNNRSGCFNVLDSGNLPSSDDICQCNWVRDQPS